MEDSDSSRILAYVTGGSASVAATAGSPAPSNAAGPSNSGPQDDEEAPAPRISPRKRTRDIRDEDDLEEPEDFFLPQKYRRCTLDAMKLVVWFFFFVSHFYLHSRPSNSSGPKGDHRANVS